MFVLNLSLAHYQINFKPFCKKVVNFSHFVCIYV